MYTPIYHNLPKARFILLFFVYAVLGLTASFIPAPVTFAAVSTQNPIYNSLPVARNVVVKEIKASTKVIRKKIALAEARLLIPRIHVNTAIKDMGLTSDGAMAVPGNRVDVGWYSLGTRPGETGSAVIGGHNFWNNGGGVFEHLNQLVPGDTLSVVDAKGVLTSFVVREIRSFDATDTNSGIFGSESGIHLNLITCSGVWNPSTQSYTKRLVIFTDVVPAV